MTVYSFTVKDSKGIQRPLLDFHGKVLLIVNTASACGFTPQYAGLQKLYETFQEEGLEILAFPCNQFGQQEPGTDEEIQQFCQLNYGVTFPVLSKIEVNGDSADPLYKFLKKEKPGPKGADIQWNFTKFLIDPEGNVVERFEPAVPPAELESKIKRLF